MVQKFAAGNRPESRAVKVLSAGLAFVFVAVCSALALGVAFSGLSIPLAWLALVFGLSGGIVAWFSTRDVPMRPVGIWDVLILIVFALVSLRAFLWLIYVRGDEICVLSPNNLGDMSLHLNLIRYLASGVPFWPESPILSGAALSYPLGTDLFNGVLEACGTDTIRALVWTGLVGAALTAYALWRWGGAFGVAAFLFNGGLMGFSVLRTLQIEDFQTKLVWKSFFLSMFVTQRGLLVALPAGLLLLYAWRERFFRSGKRILPYGFQILFYAGMPLFNFHAFLFLSLILVAIFVAKASARPTVFKFVAASVLPGTIAVALVTGFFSATSNLRFAPGWISANGGWMAWIWNFGLTLPLVLILAASLWRSKDAEARCFVWAGLFLFILCSLVVFTPWEWDNMKLLMWSWLIIAPYLWSKLIAPLHYSGRVAICFVLFFSGAIALVEGLGSRHGYGLARRSELASWELALTGIPAEARFACVPDYNHPLILLGRKVACGYEGHLWSHGLAYQGNLQILRDFIAGRIDGRSAVPALDVEWLALRKMDYPAAVPPGELPETGVGVLYNLEPLLKPDSESPALLQFPPRLVD